MRRISTRDVHLRWVVGASLLGIAGTVLAACDPAPVPDDPETARLDIDVGPAGDASADLSLAPELRDVLGPMAQRLGRAVFEAEDSTVRIDGNDGGFDYAVISAPRAYQRGDDPRVSVTVSDDAVEALEDLGVTTLEVTFCAPYVPYEIDSSLTMESNKARCGYWRMDLSFETLEATMALAPDTGRWYRSVVLTVVTLASVIAAAICLVRVQPTNWRRRGSIVLAALPGIVSFVIGMFTLAAAPNGDNLGVAGDLDGVALTIATGGPVALLPLGIACVASAIVAMVSQPAKPHPGTIS